MGFSSFSPEADPVSIVDPNAVLAASIAAESLEAIPGRRGQLEEILDVVDLIELAPRDGPETPRTRSPRGSGVGAIEDVFGAPVPEGAYHGSHYNGPR